MSDTLPSLLPRTLHLRISEQELCFARYELRREPVFAFAACPIRPRTSLTAALREACDTEPMLQQPVEKVEVLVPGAVTAVPLADFQEEDCERIYDYCFSPDEGRRHVFYDVLPQSNAVLLFALDRDTCRTLERTFGEVHYTASLTHLLKHFSGKRLRTDGGKRIFVHLHGQKADIAAFEAGRLLTVNTYDVQGEADVAYYTFCLAKHLAMDNHTDDFYVTGTTELREAAAAELRKYAREVYNLNPTGEFNRSIVSTTPDVPYDLMVTLLEL